MNIFDKHKDELSGMNWEDVLRNHAVIERFGGYQPLWVQVILPRMEDTTIHVSV